MTDLAIIRKFAATMVEIVCHQTALLMILKKLGNGECNEGTYYIPQCGYDAGDCNERKSFPECDRIGININNTFWFVKLGNDMCNSEFNTPQCGFNGLDCIAFNVNYPLCDADRPWYDNINCRFDSDDCLRFMKKYKNCHVDLSWATGDEWCDVGAYNTPECHWDGDDCLEFNVN